MRNFSARETEWLQELDGIELASFRQRAMAFLFDWVFIWIAFSVVATLLAGTYLLVRHVEGKPFPDFQHYTSKLVAEHQQTVDEERIGDSKVKIVKVDKSDDEAQHIVTGIILPILYFGFLLWKGKGQTPGKRIMKIRAVSLMHRHITFWHSVERALGYGAAALEGGFGFVQFFIHPYRRCAQDRLAETIVVTERSYKEFQQKILHPLLPDTVVNAHAPE